MHEKCKEIAPIVVFCYINIGNVPKFYVTKYDDWCNFLAFFARFRPRNARKMQGNPPNPPTFRPLNPNPPTKSWTNEHTYLFALDHKTWNPPPPLYGPTNLGDTLTNWSRSRLTNTLNLTHRQRNAALKVLATPSLEFKFNTTIKYDNIFNHPFHATTTSIVTTTHPAPFICIEFIYKSDRYTKQTLGFATFYNPHTGLSYTCRFN